ncbi:MAG: peptidyl-prolyl cis-trans isomerase D [Oleiphilaceae bacterium]|jgi:peptidyl-prolyl cis-trans isomerase D
MLQDMRKSAQGTVAKIVVGFIIVIFALFGAESIVGSIGGEPEVASVNGEGITESNFMRALEGKRRQILAQMGERVDPDLIDESLLRSSVLEGMIQEEILKQDAYDKGLFVSSVAVDSYIRGVEQFQVDGIFDGERLQVILRNAGLTLNGYRESLRSQFVLNQSRSALIASAFVLKDERNEIIQLDRQERSFGITTVLKSDYLDAITVSDNEINAYYEENKASYKKPKNVEVSFVEIKRADLGKSIEISDEELRKVYDSEKAEFEGDEERQAAHILIKIDENTTDEQALEKITAIELRLKAGEAFSVLAAELSEDEGSAEEGGDLGLSGRGVYVSDFEDALFGLKEGEMTTSVKTEFGYHLIKLLAVVDAEIPSFEEMSASLSERLINQQVAQLYAEKTESLADLSYASADLTEPADELGLDIKQLVGVSAQSSHKVFSNVKVQRVLFSDELVKDQNNSEIIEIDDGYSIVFRINALHEESVLALEDVQSRVVDVLKTNKMTEFAKSVGSAFVARVQAGEEPKAIAKDMDLSWQEHVGVKRDDIKVARELVTKVFSLSKSNTDAVGFSAANGDYSVVILRDIKAGDPTETSSLEVQSISNMLGDGFGASDYRNYQDVMVRKAEIERI